MTQSEATRRWGLEMARARDQAGATQRALARELGVSPAHISNLERGYRKPALSLLPALEKALGTDHLARLWDDLSGSGRPAWLDEIWSAIERAEAVYEYQALVWPGYLQTEACTRALVQYGAPWLSGDEIAARVAERTARARRLEAASHPKLWLVIDGTLLCRRYGGPEATREQLEYIADLVERERVLLQIVPANTPKHPGNSGAFRVLTTRDSPDVVYVESAAEGQTVTEPAEVARHRMLFATLQGISTTPDTAMGTLRDEIKRLDHE